MMDVPVILYLILFLLFVFHELEEIVFFRKWLDRNGNYLTKRFPRIGGKLIRQFEQISTKGFSIIALEEAILLFLLLVRASTTQRADLWMGVVIMLTLHWVVTLIQSMLLGRIVPGTITSIAGVCFGIYMFRFSADWYPVLVYIRWGIILFILAMANLLIMHAIIAKRLHRNDRRL